MNYSRALQKIGYQNPMGFRGCLNLGLKVKT
jgi:hypothetical protein